MEGGPLQGDPAKGGLWEMVLLGREDGGRQSEDADGAAGCGKAGLEGG